MWGLKRDRRLRHLTDDKQEDIDMDTTHALHREIAAAETLKASLRDIAGDDDELIRDTLEGQTSLRELIATVAGRIVFDNGMADGIDMAIKKMAERRSRIGKRVELSRIAILTAMQSAMIKTLETPAGTLTVKELPPKLIVTDDSEIPSLYWTAPDPVLNKRALLAALKARAEALDAAVKIESETDLVAAMEEVGHIHPQIRGVTLSNGGETLQLR